MRKLIIIMILLLISCSPLDEGIKSNQNNKYQYTVIDGMPCVHYNSFDDGREGLSCDWSKWKGSVDGTNITLPEIMYYE